MEPAEREVERFRVARPNFEKDEHGLVCVVAQDASTKEILMQAYTDEAGYRETLLTGRGVYWSRSRKRRWMKGEESGHYQEMVAILIDCDGDALIYMIQQIGPGACHTEARSCFYRSVLDPVDLMLVPKATHKDDLHYTDADVSSSLLETSELFTNGLRLGLG